MVTGQDVAEQQRHPYLSQGGHAGAHDPYSFSYSGLGEILPRYTQQLSNSLLVKVGSLVPPLVIFTLLAFLQDQRVVQELAECVCIKGDPLTRHPRAHIPNSLLGGLGVGIEFHDNLWVEFSHRGHKWCPAPTSYLFLEIRVLVLPKLDPPLSVEWPSLDGLEALLMLGTPKSEPIKTRGRARAFSSGILSGPLRGKLLRSHLLRKQTFGNLVYRELPFYKQSLVTMAYDSFRK